MGSMQPSLVCSNHQVQLSRIAETSSPGSRVRCLVHCQVLWVFYLTTPLLYSPWFPFSRSKVASGAPALTPMYQSVGWYKEGRDAVGHKGPLWLWLSFFPVSHPPWPHLCGHWKVCFSEPHCLQSASAGADLWFTVYFGVG